jgi:hypothetical protein
MVHACPTCGVLWERQGSWVTRVREPDWEKVTAARRAAQSSELLTRTPAN